MADQRALLSKPPTVKKHDVKVAEQIRQETIEGHLKYFKGKHLHAGTAAVYYTPQAKKVPGHSLQAEIELMQGEGGGRSDWRGLLRLDHKRYRHLMDGSQSTKLEDERQLILEKIGGLGFRFTGPGGSPTKNFLNAIGHVENTHRHRGYRHFGPAEATFNAKLIQTLQQHTKYHIPSEARAARDLRAYAGEYVAVHQAIRNEFKPGGFDPGFPKMSELDPAKFFKERPRLTPEQIHLQQLGFQMKAGVKVTDETLLKGYKAARKVPSRHRFLSGMGNYLRGKRILKAPFTCS